MYSYEDRIRAVKFYINCGYNAAYTVRKLGYTRIHIFSPYKILLSNPYNSLFLTLHSANINVSFFQMTLHTLHIRDQIHNQAFLPNAQNSCFGHPNSGITPPSDIPKSKPNRQ